MQARGHAAIERAKADLSRPTLIKVATTIGYGSGKAGMASVHGAPLGQADLAQLKKKSGFDEAAQFAVPADVRAHYEAAGKAGEARARAWAAMSERYASAHAELSAELRRRLAGELPAGWRDALPAWTVDDKALATRQSSNVCLSAVAQVVPELIGGSADLTPSNLTKFAGALDFQAASPEGRYIRFGVREHAMGAICNGLAAYGGLRPFCATFLNFVGYAAGAVRLSALSHFPVIWVATHDSIGLGEDGPTHQPVEMLLSLRATPNLLTLRPADGNEVAGAYATAVGERKRPCIICCSRQGCANLRGSSADAVARGAYVLEPAERPQLVLVSSGSEVQMAVAAAAELDARVSLVSMPCWELFDDQPLEYRLSVFPDGVPVLAVEAASAEGWGKYAHSVLGMRTFGASAPAKDLHKHFGFTTEAITAKARELLAFYESRPVPCLLRRPDAP